MSIATLPPPPVRTGPIALERVPPNRPAGLTRAPSRWDRISDRAFQLAVSFAAWSVLLLLVGIVTLIGVQAAPAVKTLGVAPLMTVDWDVNRDQYGILPQIVGTVVSSTLAVILATGLGVLVAILLTQNFLPRAVAGVVRNLVDLLAAIPSVIYGLWGIFYVAPALRPAADWLHANYSWIPLFSTPYTGRGMLPAAVVLAVMLLPTITAVSRDALAAVPRSLRDGAIALGATRWETIFKIVLPTAAEGIVGAVVLGFGRALGETMALAMLIGNSQAISASILSPSSTLAALLALNFPEAGGLQIGALMYAALALVAITLTVNVAGTAIVEHAMRKRRATGPQR